MLLVQRWLLDTSLSRRSYRINVRMASTLVGESGRVYVHGELLQRHRMDHALSIFKAQYVRCSSLNALLNGHIYHNHPRSGTESFVLKRVPRQFFEMSTRLAADFAGSPRLRMHVDCNRDERLLVYPYYKATLLALIKEDSELHHTQRKKALHCVAEAIQELHRSNWIHNDVKPDNVLVNWTDNDNRDRVITDVALGDFDIAFYLEDGKALQIPHAIGNAMWRSPEGQTGRGITKASDIYSFGLVCIYAMGGGELLLIENYQDLVRFGITPEQEILSRHFTYFGPAPEGLYKRVDDEVGCALLKEMSAIADAAVENQPERRFTYWSQELGPLAQDIISQMTNMDPTARPTIEQVLAHPWWQRD